MPSSRFICTLEELSNNLTFQTLTELQAVLDTNDPICTNASITRSPYHVIAFLILWQLTTDADRPKVSNKIQLLKSATLAHSALVSAEMLNQLTDEVDWSALLTELYQRDKAFLKLVLPHAVYTYIKEQASRKNACFHYLTEHKKIELAKNDFEGQIVTHLQQEAEWKKPFNESYCPLLNTTAWIVPSENYTLSDLFSNFLIEHAPQTLGKKASNIERLAPVEFETEALKISIQVQKSTQQTDDVVTLFIQHGANDQLQVRLPETETNKGIYEVFEGIIFKGSLPIERINVTLKGEAILDKNHAKAESTQKVSWRECAMVPASPANNTEHFYVHYTLLVKSVHALFHDIKTGVSFSSASKNLTTIAENNNAFLNTFEGPVLHLHSKTCNNAISLYSKQVTPLMALSLITPTQSPTYIAVSKKNNEVKECPLRVKALYEFTQTRKALGGKIHALSHKKGDYEKKLFAYLQSQYHELLLSETLYVTQQISKKAFVLNCQTIFNSIVNKKGEYFDKTNLRQSSIPGITPIFDTIIAMIQKLARFLARFFEKPAKNKTINPRSYATHRFLTRMASSDENGFFHQSPSKLIANLENAIDHFKMGPCNNNN